MQLNLHSCTAIDWDRPLYPQTPPREEGTLRVSKLHTLFYALYGNPQGVPVVVLHGGPGAGCDDSLTRFFDLERWNIAMFDQRGAMRSTPFASMEDNTPQNSVADIEALRSHLGIEKWAVFGGSWGSTLALLYGQAHPQHCLGFILRGIFLGREQDYLHLFHKMGKIFPDAFDPFFHFIPEDQRSDLLEAYYQRVMDPDARVHMPAATAFMKYDLTCSTHLPDPAGVQKVLQNERLVLSIVRVFLYYSKHRFFLAPDQILSRMNRIESLPCIIVQGRWDAVTLPDMAYDLHKNWKDSTLWIASKGGHSAKDPAIGSALATATGVFSQWLESVK